MWSNKLEAQRGNKFQDNEDVEKCLGNWLKRQDIDFFSAGIKILQPAEKISSMLKEIMLNSKTEFFLKNKRDFLQTNLSLSLLNDLVAHFSRGNSPTMRA